MAPIKPKIELELDTTKAREELEKYRQEAKASRCITKAEVEEMIAESENRIFEMLKKQYGG